MTEQKALYPYHTYKVLLKNEQTVIIEATSFCLFNDNSVQFMDENRKSVIEYPREYKNDTIAYFNNGEYYGVSEVEYIEDSIKDI